MRKTLMMLVAGLVLAGCSAKSVEVSPTSAPEPSTTSAETARTIQECASALEGSWQKARDAIKQAVVDASSVADLVALVRQKVDEGQVTVQVTRLAYCGGDASGCPDMGKSTAEFIKQDLEQSYVASVSPSATTDIGSVPAVSC